MSSTTKKPKISEESRKKLESLDTTFDLYRSLDEYIRDSRKNISYAKERMVQEFNQMGEKYVEEIDKKEQQKVETIREIFRTVGDRYGSKEELSQLTYGEVQNIQIKIKESKKNFFTRIVDFLMNWD